jgi:flagellin-like protein
MKLKKAISPVIATLLLILIAVAAAVLLYTWVSGLSSQVTGQQVTGKTLSLISATWALGKYTDDNLNDGNPPTPDYTKVVIIASFQAPPAAVGGQGGKFAEYVIDNINILFQGKPVCAYNLLAASADDRIHIGQTMGTRSVFNLGNTVTDEGKVAGVVAAGYFGSAPGTRDPTTADDDTIVPGYILFSTVTTPQEAAKGAVKANDTIASYDNAVYGSQGDLGNGKYVYPVANEPFATVIAGVWQVNYVADQYVETSFKPSGARIVYDRWASSYVDIATNDGTTVTQADLFDLVHVSQGAWSVVAYCPNININTMNSVILQIQFQDGSTWETTVSLQLQ